MKKRIMTALLAITLVTSTVFLVTGCGDKNTATPDTATTDTATIDEPTTQATTVISERETAIKDSGLSVDKDGNVVDSNGKKVEVSADGKVEVKTSDGKTVKVDVNDIKTVNDNNSSSSSTSKSNNTSTDKASSSTSSKTNSSSGGSSSNKTNSNSSSSNSSNSSSSKVENNVTTDAHAGKTWCEAITHQQKIVDEKAYSYEEPVYETHQRTICNDCGADITDLGSQGVLNHIAEHGENGGKGSYHSETRDVQVGKKTITVPEVYHYEEVVDRPAGWY